MERSPRSAAPCSAPAPDPMRLEGRLVTRPRTVAIGLLVAALGVVAWLLLGGGERIDAPAPEGVRDPVGRPDLAPSALTVPVRVDLAPLVAELEEAVPRSWGDLEERVEVSGNDRAEVAMALRRDPFDATLVGSTARVSTLIHYRARGWYDPPVLPEVSASCGTGDDERPPRLAVELEAPITLTREWRLATETRLGRLAPATNTGRDACDITFLGLDVTGRVVDAARSFLADRLSDIDGAIAGVDLRPTFAEWWSVLTEPIELDRDVWLVLNPSSLRRGEIRGEGDVVEIPVTLVARPRIVFGSRPEAYRPPLPPLDAGPIEPGLDILVEGRAEYETASDELTRALRGTRLEHAGRTVEITSIELSGTADRRLALEVGIEGDAQGRVFLVGTPRYDSGSGTIDVPDLTFDLATSDLIVRSASWLADAGIESLLRSRARWSGAPGVEWAGQKLEEGLNLSLADGVRLEGSVEEVRILDVIPGIDALTVRAAARATATLVVEAGA